MAAEKLELIYGQSPLVSQIFVYGDSLRSFLVAMIVAEHSGVMIWAKEHGMTDKSFEDLCKSPELKAAMKEDFARLMKENGLKGFQDSVGAMDNGKWSSYSYFQVEEIFCPKSVSDDEMVD